MIVSLIWLSTSARVPSLARAMVAFVTYLVPSVARISSETSNPMVSEVILSIQWLFFPIYIVNLFYFRPPWAAWVKAETKRSNEAAKKRINPLITVVLALLCLLSILGSCGVVDFPSFYNGGYIYPREDGQFWAFRAVYESNAVLALYAWVGPLLDAFVIFIFATIIFQFRGIFAGTARGD